MTSRLSNRIRRLENRMPTGTVGGVLVDTADGYRWDGREHASPGDLPFTLGEFKGIYLYITDFARDRLCDHCQQGYRANVGDTCLGCGSPLPPPYCESGKL